MAFIPPTKPGEEFKSPARGERLQRFMADQGVASRRACEEMIREGRVTINGIRITDLPVFVDPARDHVSVDGRGLGTVTPRQRASHEYVMLNKPSRVLCASKDEPGLDRATVMELVRHPSGKRLFPVGRLDWETMGLIILTDDGELANRLTHPRYNIPKTYEVTVKGLMSPAELDALRKDLRKFEKQVAKRSSGAGPAVLNPVQVEVVTQDSQRTLLRVTLKESRNREIREMLAAAGMTIRKVERVAIGPLVLGGLRTGAWRNLDKAEIKALYQASGGGGPSDLALTLPRSMGSFKPVKPRRPSRKPLNPVDADRAMDEADNRPLRPAKSVRTSAPAPRKAAKPAEPAPKRGPRVLGPKQY